MTGASRDRVFPSDFLWGAATAAHQVEGDNTNSDWWAWEHKPHSTVAEPSGRACEHYTRYRDDIGLLAGLGLNTYRYSVEWARIEPTEGTYDEEQLDHYRDVTDAVLAAGLTPMVTLHHFTEPLWFAARGGWRAPDAADRFGRYCARVARHLEDRVKWWCTLNEPGNVAVGGYLGLFGWPPGTGTLDACERASAGLQAAHRRATEAVKSQQADARLGMTHGMQEWESNLAGRAPMLRVRRMLEDEFLDAAGDDDFLGVQTYTRVPVVVPAALGPAAWLVSNVAPIRRRLLPPMMRRAFTEMSPTTDEQMRRTDMGYEFRPEAIGATLRRAAARWPGKDLVVTEHGIATNDDSERIEFIERGLHTVADTVDAGLPVRGYVYWSLLDNFEWAHGYRTRFGLIDVDRTTMQRNVRGSARYLGEIARAGTLRADADGQAAR